MPYPPIYKRLGNFQRDANNGLPSPAPAKVDAELNNIQLALAQAITVLRGVTSADGRLRNVAQAIAQSLVGSWYGPAPASPGPVVTTIPAVATMSASSILVMVGATVLAPDTFTVDVSGAFVEITPTSYPATGTKVTVWAFEPGAGILTQLASTATGDGAELIGVEDSGNFFAATTVEGALAETAGALVALQTALGDLADYFKRDGSVAATGNFDLATAYKIINAIDGVDPGDYVTVRQIANYIAAWTDLSLFFLKRDGTTAMAGAMNFGNNKGYNLADPDLAEPLDAVNVRAMLKAIASSGASPVGVMLDYIGDTAPQNWLICDGQAYLGTTYPVLYDLLGSAYKTGSAQGAIAAKFPLLIGANLTVPAGPGGLVNPIPAMTLQGVGYVGIPRIEVVNPPAYPPPTLQPTFTVSVSANVIDGPNVTGGALTITFGSAGTGIYPGAAIVIYNDLAAAPGTPAIAALPSGYFRTPDLRGRVSVGVGTESKTPGIVDPPDVSAGDTYTAVSRAIGAYGGEAMHRLTVDELARHSHPGTARSVGRDYGGFAFTDADSGAGPSAGNDVAHNTLPPFHVVNKIIKAQ